MLKIITPQSSKIIVLIIIIIIIIIINLNLLFKVVTIPIKGTQIDLEKFIKIGFVKM